MSSTKRAQRLACAAALLAAGTFALSACGSATSAADAAAADNTLVFAMPPGTDDPDILSEAKVIQGFIAEATGKEVSREMPADYLGVVEAVRQGHVDVAVMSPFSTALAVKNGSVDPLIVWNKDATKPASYCYAKPGSGIESIADVAGKTVSFVDPGSTTGYFMPKSLLADNGLIDGEDYESAFAGGHDSALLAMVNGSVDVACSSIAERIIESGALKKSDLQLIGETAPIPVGIGIVVSPDLSEETRQQLLDTLPEKMTNNPEILTLGGATEYIKNPGIAPYEPLLKVAENVGVDLKDMR
jgi:phosphonate transport system substrate-binding protein